MLNHLTCRVLLTASGLLCASPGRAVTVPAGQPYVLRDGSVAIVGNDGLEDVIRELNALFTRMHPDVHFNLRMEGSWLYAVSCGN